LLRLLLALCSSLVALFIRWVVFAFSFFGMFFAFAFAFAFAFSQAAIRCLTSVSALVPMAQMKPNSSRATAVVIFLLSLPAAANRR
jgi:hypothetical protein